MPSGPDARINVLLIGGGGREHALARRLASSPSIGTLYATHTTNPGIGALAKHADAPIDPRKRDQLERFCRIHEIGLVVVGPEDPLAEGVADALETPTRKVFGPVKAAARLEADKSFAKQIMRAAAIPTAESRTFSDADSAEAYIRGRSTPPVVKASGLAKGKGVIVAETIEEACDAVDRIMRRRIFGDAGATVVLEERLEGAEVSVLAIVDGRSILTLPACRDHKRLGDGDTGPNTGGMGAYCPSDIVDDETLAMIERSIIVPAIDALARDGTPFRGVLYAGCILTHAGPKALEFNVRFGDPECQTLMARFRGDLVALLRSACESRLEAITDEGVFEWDPRPACTIVLASRGYPEKPVTGLVIEGVELAEAMDGVLVDHAGTVRNASGQLLTAGGRVLGVTALGGTLAEARDRAYEAAAVIRFEGKTVRTDIAGHA